MEAEALSDREKERLGEVKTGTLIIRKKRGKRRV